MSSRKRKRLSVWALLNRLGLTGDHDAIIEHVFTAASRLTLQGDDGEPMSGDDFLVSVFESLGTTKDSPGCGTPEWERLRTVALRRVVARLSREGLLDSIAVGCATASDCETNSDSKPPAAKEKGLGSGGADATDGDDKPDVAAERRPAKTSNTMLRVSGPVAEGDGSVADGVGSDTANAKDGEDESDVETPAAKEDGPDRREGVEVLTAMLRRGRRNPEGWFSGVERDTPYRVLAQWASETCPGVATERLSELMDGLREVRWWDNDGHVHGAEMLRVLESELEAGCRDERWMCVVSDFEDAIRRLRGVFERLCLL